MKPAVALALALAFTFAGTAAPALAGPLRADHPMIGAWRVTVEGCTEVYRVDRSGSMLVTSAQQVSESSVEISDQPSDKGFYKWVDTLVRDNGKKDCAGQISKAPHTTTSYILLNPAHDRFIMCGAEDGKQCIGPFVRLQDGEI